MRVGDDRRLEFILAVPGRRYAEFCDLLYSEDLSDGQLLHEAVTVRNPFR